MAARTRTQATLSDANLKETINAIDSRKLKNGTNV